jgi:hypothetical protein
MRTDGRWLRHSSSLVSLIIVLVLAVVVSSTKANPQGAASSAQAQANHVSIGPSDIGGVVASAKGPEAGVWVIAETGDLPTKYRKIVVTDDRGRYLIPDLPKARYKLWVRGYGLVDGPTVSQVEPGQKVALTAVIAPNAKAAAQYYPANYWYSLLKVPPKSDFPMTVTLPALRGGGTGAGDVSAAQQTHTQVISTQADWVSTIKNCNGVCHQMGTRITREIPPALYSLDNSKEEWNQRLRFGQLGNGHVRSLTGLGLDHALSLFADWSDRIAGGELPSAPPRPSGVERNLVVTLWDIGTPITFMHDLYATDERDPTVNGYGPVYGSDFNLNNLMILDPKRNTVDTVPMPFRDPDELDHFSPQTMEKPSLYYGNEIIWDERSESHVKDVDSKGRVWVAYAWRSRLKPPDFCKEGAPNKYTQFYPIAAAGANRQLSYYDPKTRKFRLIDTCYGTRHVAFADDADETQYWGGNQSGVVGWIKPRILDAGGSDEAAQGWCVAYYDLNGDGKYEKDIDKVIPGVTYYFTYNPVDKSIWYAAPGTPGKIVRLEIGDNPPETCRAEAWEPPFYDKRTPGKLGYIPRGIDADGNGLIWTGLAGSGSLASFDRSKCVAKTTPQNTEDLQRCPEGWTLYDLPGPQLKGITDGGTADFIYGNWVDRFDTLGLGKNVPMATGTGSDAMVALMPDTKRWVVLRVPYPLGFNARNLSGRIDDPNGGWKGRGLWVGNEIRNPWHIEGGKGTYPQAAHFQLRPNPLAK